MSPYIIRPLKLKLLDGSFGLRITHAVDLTIRHSTGDIFGVMFYVTQLDSPIALVFGYNWLHSYNPLIDWSGSQILSFWTPLQISKPLPSGLQLPELWPTDSELSQLESTLTGPPLLDPRPADSTLLQPESPPSSPVTPEVEPKLSVLFINAVAYACTACMKGSVPFQLSLLDPSLLGHSSSTTSAKPDLSSVPKDYHEFEDVFSQAKADTLPLHRPYNLKINLEEGTKPPLGSMYSLSQTKVGALCEFLNKNLRIGFIRPSKAGHRAPILFVKKKDSLLQLCVDFCRLNRIMKKDHYPLPLISDLLNTPGKACNYMKIDLQHAYHLVRVAKGDKAKTTFRMHYGLFKWLVIPEGLINASSAFQ